MKLWLDVHLPPAIVSWLCEEFGVEASSFGKLGFRTSTDEDVFATARAESTIIVSKDADFANLVERLGSPPQVIWVTCGNTTNANLRRVFSATLPKALELLSLGESLVEIHDRG